MLVAVGSWGLYAVAGRFAMKHVSAYLATLWAGMMGVLFMLPFDLPTISFHQLTVLFWISLFYTAIGGTVIAMILWNIGIQRVGGTKSGIFLNFNPIFTDLLAYLLMGETIEVSQVIGTLIVIAGVSLFSISEVFSISTRYCRENRDAEKIMVVAIGFPNFDRLCTRAYCTQSPTPVLEYE